MRTRKMVWTAIMCVLMHATSASVCVWCTCVCVCVCVYLSMEQVAKSPR